MAEAENPGHWLERAALKTGSGLASVPRFLLDRIERRPRTPDDKMIATLVLVNLVSFSAGGALSIESPVAGVLVLKAGFAISLIAGLVVRKNAEKR